MRTVKTAGKGEIEIVQGKFAKQILCKVKPGKKFQDYFLYYSRPKKKMYELVFSERYMLL